MWPKVHIDELIIIATVNNEQQKLPTGDVIEDANRQGHKPLMDIERIDGQTW
jgi:hypothetical protein